jgi:hypothetical protein
MAVVVAVVTRQPLAAATKPGLPVAVVLFASSGDLVVHSRQLTQRTCDSSNETKE